ncbi:hypothetical protein AZA_04487 [Nitrospirillum viridazoti Y2]|nr:hypothetical protein AZA_04487 [Nitrospirillum amazonense Y2]
MEGVEGQAQLLHAGLVGAEEVDGIRQRGDVVHAGCAGDQAVASDGRIFGGTTVLHIGVPFDVLGDIAAQAGLDLLRLTVGVIGDQAQLGQRPGDAHLRRAVDEGQLVGNLRRQEGVVLADGNDLVDGRRIGAGRARLLRLRAGVHGAAVEFDIVEQVIVVKGGGVVAVQRLDQRVFAADVRGGGRAGGELPAAVKTEFAPAGHVGEDAAHVGNGAGGGQRPFARPGIHLIPLGVVQGDDDMAATVVDVAAEGQVGTIFGAAMLGAAVGDRALDTLEIPIQDEVHHAGHGIGAVDRRRTARQHVHPLDQRHRDAADVDGIAEAERGRPGAVDQHQRPALPEVAQVEDLGAEGIAALGGGTHAARQLRQLGGEILHGQRLLQANVLRRGRGHRAGRRQAGPGNARARHHDFFQAGIRRLGAGRGGGLRVGVTGQRRQEKQRCRQRGTPMFVPHAPSPPVF